MKMLIALAAAAAVQLQSPQAVIECAEAVQEHNRLVEEMSSALQSYSQCMNADRIDACSAEFRRLEEIQGRYELMIERLRRQCPEEELRQMERTG